LKDKHAIRKWFEKKVEEGLALKLKKKQLKKGLAIRSRIQKGKVLL